MTNSELEKKLFNLYEIAESKQNINMMFKILEFIYKIKFKNKKDDVLSLENLSDEDLAELMKMLQDG